MIFNNSLTYQKRQNNRNEQKRSRVKKTENRIKNILYNNLPGVSAKAVVSKTSAAGTVVISKTST